MRRATIELLDLLRPGDILTHAYSGAGNNTVQNGRVLPAALAAKQRGVIIDVGHGGGSFDYTVFEPATRPGVRPRHDQQRHPRGERQHAWPTLPALGDVEVPRPGMPLEEVVARATVEPAKVIGRVAELGTLQVGAPGDAAILERRRRSRWNSSTRATTRAPASESWCPI